jgi:putative sterol carrier protein
MNIVQIFEAMPKRYKAGSAKQSSTFYFSVGDHKYTVKLGPDGCTVDKGKTVENADVVLKTTPELFEKMVIHGKLPGALDIARGKVKTNDPGALKKLRDYFDFSGL